ncbi:hypothetical protein M3Y96_00927300 [Aphelenchoides besseyi]|nr:hypothetical protein M3Y96_00927300 [Aphelenchoides besseyi]
MVKRRPVEEYSSSEDEESEEGGQLGVDETEESGDDTDREIQVAFSEGLLPKEGLIQLTRSSEPKRNPINKKEELKQKLFQIKQDLPWSGTLDVTFDEELRIDTKTDDFKRDTTIYNQALCSVRKAIPMLEAEGIPVFRPDDYFAEMSKSDDHMQKVRQRLLNIQKEKEQSENARRIREERKFSAKAKTASVHQKHENKRKLMEAVKNHRKGIKSQLETMLDNAAEFNDFGEDDEPRKSGRSKSASKMTRNARNKKYGYGGQKKRSKRNDKESFNNVFEGKKKSGMKRRR